MFLRLFNCRNESYVLLRGINEFLSLSPPTHTNTHLYISAPGDIRYNRSAGSAVEQWRFSLKSAQMYPYFFLAVNEVTFCGCSGQPYDALKLKDCFVNSARCFTKSAICHLDLFLSRWPQIRAAIGKLLRSSNSMWHVKFSWRVRNISCSALVLKTPCDLKSSSIKCIHNCHEECYHLGCNTLRYLK